jgi:chemotaxis protein histidine kinase CheA
MSKETLAKLLAQEDITVVHQGKKTASFDVKQRILSLPVWKDMEGFTYDHFVGHEVGHALWTPEAGWHENASTKGAAYKGFLNVVEDARIEKLIQRQYPGLKKNFIKSYNKLFASNFFGEGDANERHLIDRINIYFKCGAMSGVKFSDAETPWIDEINALETWEEVVDVTDRLFEFAKDQIKEQKNQPQEPQTNEDPDGEGGEVEMEMSEDDSAEEVEADTEQQTEEESEEETEEGEAEEEADANSKGEAEEEPEGEGDSNSEEATDDEEDEDEDEEIEGEDHQFRGNLSGSDYNEEVDEDEIASETDDLLRENMEKLVEDNIYNVTNINLPTKSSLDRIEGFKTILDAAKGTDVWELIKKHGPGLYGNFVSQNKNAINHLVKEFESKKQAAEYSRTSMAKTGVIDHVKMNTYQVNDDIFRKMAITPDGKNHGMIMYVDWSGSMSGVLYDTIKQTLMLVSFCRQVGIPFRVYAFSNRPIDCEFLSNGHFQKIDARQKINNPVGELDYQGLRLLELFSDKMKKSSFLEMSSYLLCYSAMCKYRRGDGDSCEDTLLVDFNVELSLKYNRFTAFLEPYTLCGTPLNEAIIAGIDIHKMFKTSMRLDIVSTVILTDGAGATPCHNNGGYLCRTSAPGKNYRTFIHDTKRGVKYAYTKKVVAANGKTKVLNEDFTALAIKILKDNTKSPVIGINIVESSQRFGSAIKNHVVTDGYKPREYQSIKNRARADFKRTGWHQVESAAHDLYLLVSANNMATKPNKNAPKPKRAPTLAKSFAAAQTNKKESRLLLSSFAAIIA